MARALPIHVIHEIERRWQRRLDASPKARPSKKVDRGAGHCPLCLAPASIEPTTAGNAISILDYLCSARGHAWRSEAQ
jgi:hypothetical protein